MIVFNVGLFFLKSENSVDSLLGNDLETNNETTPTAKREILNKQVYVTVTE
jgi:hypothetical protein